MTTTTTLRRFPVRLAAPTGAAPGRHGARSFGCLFFFSRSMNVNAPLRRQEG